jgi:hypothetical protein
MYPYNHKKGQKIQTDASGVSVDRAFLAHYHIAGANLGAASTVNILPFTKLGATAQAGVLPAAGIPDCPRNVQIDCNNAGNKKNVVIHGTNFAGETISETIALNETTAVAGNLAFASVTAIDLPVQHNAGAKQKTTSAITAATGAGTATLTLTAACLGEESPFDFDVVFAAGDVASTTTAAAKIKATINADPLLKLYFLAANSTANLTLERLINENQDATINLVVKAAGDTGLQIGSITVDTVTGVCDEVSIGWGAKIGIPYCIYADEMVIANLFDKADDAGTITNDAADIEKNVFALAGTPDGEKDLDLYIIV